MHHVIELDVPATMSDDPDRVTAFRQWVDVANRAETAVHGLPELAWLPEEQLPTMHDLEAPSRLFAIRAADGTIVAAGVYDSKTATDTPNCWISVAVLPEHQRGGLGTALADHLESVARAEGRTQWKTYAPSGTVGATAGPGRIAPPTGAGAVAEDDAAVRFLTGRGWRFGQVNRISRLALPADAATVERMRAAAASRGDRAYDVHVWTGPTPDRWLVDVARLHTRMSTDAPAGDMDEPEDVWSVERLREHEAQLDRAPRTMLTVAVEHRESTTLAGFTQLAVPDRLEQAVMQWDTLVVREHRGRRLGMLMKTVGVQAVERDFPGRPSIVTFNAEENRPMLDVNEAVGFVGVGSEGIWEKRPS